MSNNTYTLSSERLGQSLLYQYILFVALPVFFASKLGYIVSYTPFAVTSLLLGAGISILALLNLEFGVTALIVLAPFPGLVASKMFGIYTFNAFNMVYCAVCLNILLSAIYNKKEIKIFTPITLPLLFFILLDLIARLRGGNFFEISSVKFWFENLLKPIQYMILFFIVLNAISNRTSIYKYLAIMITATVFVSLFEAINLIRFMEFRGFSYTFPDPSSFPSLIVHGGVHSLGQFFAFLVPLILALFYAVKIKKLKVALLASITLSFPALLFSHSRVALISLIVGLVFFSIVGRKKHLIFILLVLLVLSPLYLPQSVKEKFSFSVWTTTLDTSGEYYKGVKKILKGELESSTPAIEGEKQWWATEGVLWRLNNATGGRFLIWTGVYKFLKDNVNPFFVIFGGGAGVFETNAPRYLPAIGQASDVHNQYLEAFINEGLLGLFVFLWLFYVMLKESSLVYIKSEEKIFKAIGLGVMSYLLILSIINLFATRFPGGDLNVYLWVLLAMVIWIKNRSIHRSKG